MYRHCLLYNALGPILNLEHSAVCVREIALFLYIMDTMYIRMKFIEIIYILPHVLSLSIMFKQMFCIRYMSNWIIIGILMGVVVNDK